MVDRIMNDVDQVKISFSIYVDVNTSILMFIELNLSESTQNRIKLIHKDLMGVSRVRSLRLTNENFEYIKHYPTLSKMKDGEYIISYTHFLELLHDHNAGMKSFSKEFNTIVKCAAKNVESHNKVMEYINR